MLRILATGMALLLCLLAQRPACATTAPIAGSNLATPHVSPPDTMPKPALSLKQLHRAIRREQRLLNQEQRGRPVRDTDFAEEPGVAPGGGFAIAALALGVLGVLAFFTAVVVWNSAPFILVSVVSFVLAVIFGAIGMKRSKLALGGKRGLAIAGFVLGLVGAAFYAFLLALVISLSV